MKMRQTCVGCILEQSKRVASVIRADLVLTDQLYSAVEKMSKDFTLELSPPEEAASVYANMARIAKKEDLFKEIKEISTRKAQEFVPILKERINAASDRFLTATKVAVAGNVIDLASQIQFDLDAEVAKVFDMPFSLDDTQLLQEKLQLAKEVFYIADNAGEHIFDKLYIETLRQLFPQIHVTYVTRGVPIINDITYDEAIGSGLNEVATVIDSGVITPGFVLEDINQKTMQLYEKSDLVIAKGMGNYETMDEIEGKSIFFLLKVKCDVVASHLNQNLGDLVCKYSL